MSFKDSVSAVDILELDGSTDTVGTPSVTVLKVDSDKMVLLAKGATVPTDADAGYAQGCIFIYTSGGIGTTLYINEGSATSADFNAIESVASVITGVTAGSGLSGGGTSGTISLAVAADITQNQTLSGTTVILGRTSGTVAILSDVVPNDTAGAALKVSGTGTAFAITPANLTNLFTFATATGAVSTVTGTAFTGTCYNIKMKIGNDTVYLKATTEA